MYYHTANVNSCRWRGSTLIQFEILRPRTFSSEECAPPSNTLGVLSTVVRSVKGLFGWKLCSLRCVKHIVTQCNSALVKKILSDYNTLKQCYYQESFVRILLVCIEISTMLDYPTHLWHIVENKIDILISEAQPSQCNDTNIFSFLAFDNDWSFIFFAHFFASRQADSSQWWWLCTSWTRNLWPGGRKKVFAPIN